MSVGVLAQGDEPVARVSQVPTDGSGTCMRARRCCGAEATGVSAVAIVVVNVGTPVLFLRMTCACCDRCNVTHGGNLCACCLFGGCRGGAGLLRCRGVESGCCGVGL